ncbi:hypothetical protein RCL1_007783 [Eukaryota sp. TZLM3-RCL]
MIGGASFRSSHSDRFLYSMFKAVKNPSVTLQQQIKAVLIKPLYDEVVSEMIAWFAPVPSNEMVNFPTESEESVPVVVSIHDMFAKISDSLKLHCSVNREPSETLYGDVC